MATKHPWALYNADGQNEDFDYSLIDHNGFRGRIIVSFDTEERSAYVQLILDDEGGNAIFDVTKTADPMHYEALSKMVGRRT